MVAYASNADAKISRYFSENCRNKLTTQGDTFPITSDTRRPRNGFYLYLYGISGQIQYNRFIHTFLRKFSYFSDSTYEDRMEVFSGAEFRALVYRIWKISEKDGPSLVRRRQVQIRYFQLLP